MVLFGDLSRPDAWEWDPENAAGPRWSPANPAGLASPAAAFDTVRLVLAKPLHGTVPSVIGLSSQAALERLAARGLKPVVGGLIADGGGTERVISQTPGAGVAAAPGMGVTLVVAR